MLTKNMTHLPSRTQTIMIPQRTVNKINKLTTKNLFNRGKNNQTKTDKHRKMKTEAHINNKMHEVKRKQRHQ